MTVTMIAKKYFSVSWVMVFLYSVSIWIHDDGQIIEFWDCLQLYFVTPCPWFTFEIYVSSDINSTVLLKELFVQLYIVHSKLTDKIVALFCTI